MSVVGIVSMKGGVGKTTLTANLASSLAQKLGPGRVSALDLDPQNALHWHFNIDNTQVNGLCRWAVSKRASHIPLLKTAADVRCGPYGFVSEQERQAFEEKLVQRPNWLDQLIRKYKLDHEAIVLVDTPPGPTVYLRQLMQCVDLLLVVVLPDGGSFLTVPAMETFLDGYADARPELLSAYVVNQVEADSSLQSDVQRMLAEDLGPRVCPVTVRREDVVGEAVAYQTPLCLHEPKSLACADISRLSDWVLDVLQMA